MKNPIFQYWRILACLCIVLHHTICVFGGGWPPLGYSLVTNIPTWIGDLSSQTKTFGLTSFTFISGAVLAYAYNHSYTYWQFIWRKTKRILIPALIFGLAYWILFPTLMFNTWPAPINGTHLWYLPMIFLCIIVASAHIFSNNSLFWIVVSYFVLRKIAMYIPFRTIEEFLYYFPIFYAGYVMNAILWYPEKFRNSFLQPTHINRWISICVLFIGFVFFSKISGRANSVPNLPIAGLYCVVYCMLNVCVQHVENKQIIGGGKIIGLIDRNCLAIYLLHQFILNAWGLYGASIINDDNIYGMLMCVFLTTFVGALAIAELYDKVINWILKKYEKRHHLFRASGIQ